LKNILSRTHLLVLLPVFLLSGCGLHDPQITPGTYETESISWNAPFSRAKYEITEIDEKQYTASSGINTFKNTYSNSAGALFFSMSLSFGYGDPLVYHKCIISSLARATSNNTNFSGYFLNDGFCFLEKTEFTFISEIRNFCWYETVNGDSLQRLLTFVQTVSVSSSN
jgi:hypothetical protein